MKKYILVLFCIWSIAKTYGQDTIYSIAYTFPQPVSSFEDRDTANYFYIDTTQTNILWQIGTPSKAVFNSAYSPTLALVTDTLNTYPNGNISSFEFVIKSDDWTFISFWHRYNSDSLADGGIVEVSNDGGASWTNVINAPGYWFTNFYTNTNTITSNSNKPGFTGNSGWVKSTIHFPVAMNYVRFKFTFTSDNTNTNKDGWIIDSFDFTCIGTGIKEINANSPIHIFPNPTSNFIFIRSDNSVQFRTAIIKDIVGKTILTTDRTNIDLSQFKSGLYFIEVTTDKEKYLARIVRQ
jgi:hypothetical protein